MAVSGLGVAYAAAGFVLLWSGYKNTTVKDTLTSFLKGQQPAAHPTGPPTIGIGSGASQPGSPSPGAPGPSVPPGSGGANQAVAKAVSGSEAANQALGRAMAAAYGWATGAEWNALNNIVMAESGWNNTAQNPTSTAYGIFQFLDTTWASVGYTKTSDPAVQIAAGLKYIRQKYGDPVAAWAFHLANGWY